jgi:hypothetical protein
MTLVALNLWTALASFAGALLFLALGHVASGMVWLLASLVWIGAAVFGLARRPDVAEPAPIKRMGRRLSRMIMFFSIC